MDEFLRNEAKQSRKRALEEYLERQQDMKRLALEVPRTSAPNESIHGIPYSLDKLYPDPDGSLSTQPLNIIIKRL